MLIVYCIDVLSLRSNTVLIVYCTDVLSLSSNTYNSFQSDILSDVFFPPNQDGHAALVETFAVFGGAFLMRPVGGVMVSLTLLCLM